MKEAIKRIEEPQIITTVEQVPGLQPITYTLFEDFASFIDASPKSVKTYGYAIKQFCDYLSFNGITQPVRDDVIAFRESLKAAGRKPTTVQNYITAVKLFFQWAEQAGIYPNISAHVKGAKIGQQHKKDSLTSGQVKDIMASIITSDLRGLRDYALFALMVTGGLRTIEVSRANIEDLRAYGDNTVLFIQGKGREEKTDFIKIAAPVEKAIRAYLAARGNTPEASPLFASLSHHNQGERMTTRAISGIIKNRLISAGYNSSRLTAHSLRHTAVTLSLLAGNDITEVQQFARHSNINTTMIYNHALEKSRNSCNESIANAIF